MVTETNAEQVLSGEASSSRRKRQRLPSIVEDEAEGVEGENVGEGTATGNQNIDGDEVIITEVRSGTLFDLDLLDCPVCCHPLTNPIFQCDNGHIACSDCCIQLRNQCPSCTLPIGHYRCRIMERVVEAIVVPCPNSKHGCTEKFSYGKDLVHAKVCSFALCYCPAPDCNYAGVYKDLYRHYSNHCATSGGFTCGFSNDVWMHISDKILVLQEHRDTPLVAVQCFEEPQGLYVTVNCIAPCAPGVAEFYHLSYSPYGGNKTMSFGLGEMNRIQKVSFQTPENDFMCVPHYFLAQRANLKMKICIRRRGEEHAETEVVDNFSQVNSREEG